MKQYKTAVSLLDMCLNHTRLPSAVRQHGSIIINDFDIENFSRCFRNDLNGKERTKLMEYLSQKYGHNPSKSNAKHVAKYEQLFDLIMRLPDGLLFLVEILNDLFLVKDKSKALSQLSSDLSGYIRPCFTPGYLKLRRITIDSAPEILEGVKQNDAIHPITTYQDLERRFRSNRRCYTLFHDELHQTPLIILHVALTNQLTSRVSDILSTQEAITSKIASVEGEEEPNTAMFYSLSSTQKGLRGFNFGFHVIMNALPDIKDQFPAVERFATLSPIPGFRNWLLLTLQDSSDTAVKEEIERLSTTLSLPLTDTKQYLSSKLNDSSWLHQGDVCDALQEPLTRICFHYLRSVKRPKTGQAADPVANFHLSNGAIIWRLNWMANPTEKGFKESISIMVNYMYVENQLEGNRKEYFMNKTVMVGLPLQDIHISKL